MKEQVDVAKYKPHNVKYYANIKKNCTEMEVNTKLKKERRNCSGVG
jgi:hypothetical protein